MSISDYQKAALQVIGIPVFEYQGEHVSSSKESTEDQTKVSQPTQDKQESSVTLSNNTPEYAIVEASNPLLQDLLHAIGEQEASNFSWQVGNTDTPINLTNGVLVSPPLDALSTTQKRQIWQILYPIFDASQWS